jgi:hypothetical protein
MLGCRGQGAAPRAAWCDVTPTTDIAGMRPVPPDDHAQIWKLPVRLAHIADEMGLGRPHPGGRRGQLYSRAEERLAIAERERRREQPAPAQGDPPECVVVYEDPRLALLQGLREVELELLTLTLRVRALTAIVLAGGERAS